MRSLRAPAFTFIRMSIYFHCMSLIVNCLPSLILPYSFCLSQHMPFHRGKNIIFGSTFGKPEHTVECVKTEEVAVLGRFILRWRARTRVLIFPCPICSRYPDCASHFDLSRFRWNVK